MEKSPATRSNSDVDAPGIGVAGQVFCPLTKSICLKSGCEWWVELYYGEQRVGRCTASWLSVLIPELRQELERWRKQGDNTTQSTT